MRCACASIAALGSNGSRRPYAAAVPGMNCAMPCAPAGERANGLKFDSAYSCAASSAAPTLQRCAARVIAGAQPLWLLDEPGNGLDAASLKLLGQAIAAHRAAGGIVIAATHQPVGLDDAIGLALG